MEQKLNFVMNIGEQMLVCGAEVHRVEDSVMRMCKAYGADRTDVFIITSSMVVTVFKNDKSYTQTRRITSIGTDLEKLHKLNELSRRICNSDAISDQNSLKKDFDSIIKSQPYPLFVQCLCYCVISGSFALFFGGGFSDALISALIGAIIKIISNFLERTDSNKIFTKFILSFTATTLSYIAYRLSVISSVDKVMIGIIMTLIPGIGLTNALRDLFSGDSIAAILRAIEAALLALAIAAGYFLFAFISGGVVL